MATAPTLEERWQALSIDPAVAARVSPADWAALADHLEEQRCTLARKSFREFVRQIDIPGTPPDKRLAMHHELLVQTLQLVADGKLRRVMLFLPPGSAKSSYASVAFPAYFMGRHPRRNAIVLSYGSDLARKFGRRCRTIVQSEQFAAIFGTSIVSGVSAADGWALENGSEYMAGGLLSGVTGNRADGLIIDDPVRGQRDADSQAFSSATWDAFNADASTRLKPGGFIILVQTRWSMTDLAGMLLPADYDNRTGIVRCRDGHDWLVISVPMEAERADDPLGRKPGELLWTKQPDGSGWFDAEDVLKIKNAPHMGRVWASLYQQRPALDEGLYFRREWFKPADRIPQNLRFYGASDFAVTADDGDWTVHVVVGIDAEHNLYITDLWRQRVTPDVGVDAMLDLMKLREPLAWATDRDLIVNSIGPFIQRRMAERRIWGRIDELSLGRNDKAQRARSFQARAAQGKVFVPTGAPWLGDLMTELMLFPAGRHDDQVDALGLIGRLLDIMVEAFEPQPEPERRSDGYGWNEPAGGSKDWMLA